MSVGLEEEERHTPPSDCTMEVVADVPILSDEVKFTPNSAEEVDVVVTPSPRRLRRRHGGEVVGVKKKVKEDVKPPDERNGQIGRLDNEETLMEVEETPRVEDEVGGRENGSEGKTVEKEKENEKDNGAVKVQVMGEAKMKEIKTEREEAKIENTGVKLEKLHSEVIGEIKMEIKVEPSIDKEAKFSPKTEPLHVSSTPSKSTYCVYCSWTAPSTEILQAHRAIQHGSMFRIRFHCPSHGRFGDYNRYFEHFRTLHHLSQEQLFPCEICRDIYFSSTERDSHIRENHCVQRTFACSICHKTYGTNNNLIRHKKRIHLDASKIISEEPEERGSTPPTLSEVNELQPTEIKNETDEIPSDSIQNAQPESSNDSVPDAAVPHSEEEEEEEAITTPDPAPPEEKSTVRENHVKSMSDERITLPLPYLVLECAICEIECDSKSTLTEHILSLHREDIYNRL